MTADPLLDRLRDADPAAALPDTPPSRAGLRAARRRRSRRRRAAVPALAAVLAAGTVLALALPGGGPAVAQVLDRAAEAAELPANAIVVTTSEVEAQGTVQVTRRTWVRTDAGGAVVQARFVTSKDGSETAEEAMHRRADGRWVMLRRDPATGAVTRELDSWGVPSLTVSARGILERAQRGDTVVELDGEEVVDGRRALRIDVTGVQEEPLPGDRELLLVDAETYEPVELRRHSEGLDVNGDPYVSDTIERVLDQRTLPEGAASRAQLELDGPRG